MPIDVEVEYSDIGMVMYTSGTTGPSMCADAARTPLPVWASHGVTHGVDT